VLEPAVVSGCTVVNSQITLNAGQSLTIFVRYMTGSIGNTATITLRAMLQVNPAVSDLGSVSLSIGYPAAQVTPHGGAVGVPANRTALTANFMVSNTGGVYGTFNLQVSCPGGGISNCSITTPSIYLAGGTSVSVPVHFNSGAEGSSGLIKLSSTLSTNSAVTDTGSISVSVIALPQIAVTPKTGILAPPPSTPNRIAVFQLANTGGAIGTYNLSVACSAPAAQSCTSSLASPVTIAANSTVLDTIRYASGSNGSTGPITLSAILTTDPTVADSGRYTVTVTGGAQPEVTPHGGTVPVPPNAANQSTTFKIKNIGNAVGSFTVSVSCPSAATPSGCSLGSSTINNLAAGDSVFDTVQFTSGGLSTSGPITMTAVLTGSPAVKDSGWVTVNVTGTTGIVVAPHAGTQSVPASLSQNAIFTLQNTGNFTNVFQVTYSCNGAASCSKPPRTVTIAPGGANTIADTVGFTAGSVVGSTGTIQLVAVMSPIPPLSIPVALPQQS
jgi:hypothetical protein